MTFNISNLSRSLWIITGQKEQVSENLLSSLQDYVHDSLLVTDKPEIFPSITSVSSKQASNYLGQEKKLVIVDIYDAINPDAIAAVTGLIVGGGSLVFLMPAQDEWKSVYKSRFSRRFISSLEAGEFSRIITLEDQKGLQNIFDSLINTRIESEIKLTVDQVYVADQITSVTESDNKRSLVITSDRGRGKSTALGIVASQLLKNRKI
ncbi:MAG: DUF1726 domain-containing protein, partial [Gammaproteobacteria bacterium]|nr:DUF1726 domain-containing protein [Gammaproteobacteria bacterium]